MKKVIIIDDEPLARRVVAEYLKEYPELTIVAECNNGFEGVKAIEEYQPDIIFLDVQMPKINGFEMLELIDQKPKVIFTTAFDEYALKAFEVNAIDYLLKPFAQDRFEKALERVMSEKDSTINKTEIQLDRDEFITRVVIKDGSEIKIVPAEKVNYLEAYDDYVKIHTDEKTYLKKQTLSHFESSLDPTQFVRTHRSYLINVNSLTKIEGFEKNSYRAILKCGARIPISRSTYKDLKKSLGL